MKRWQIIGFVFTGILGVILHFLYDYTGSVLVSLFSAVNESIFEHTKLLFFPMLVYAIIENRNIGLRYRNFMCVKLIGILLGVILTPVLYYTINGAFGMTPDWVNIGIFFIVDGLAYAFETWIMKNSCISCKNPGKVMWVLGLMVILYVVFTFIPPHIPFFQDPITGTYGI